MVRRAWRVGTRPLRTAARRPGAGLGAMTVSTGRVLTDRAQPTPPAAYWELLMNLTRREVKGRYSQTLFGFAWAIAQPLATMAVFTLVFSRLAKIDSAVPYPVFAYSG